MTTIEQTQTQSQSNGASKKTAEMLPIQHPAAQEIMGAETPAELHLALIKSVGLKNPEKAAEMAFGLMIYTDLKGFGEAFLAIAQQQSSRDLERSQARLEIEQQEAKARIAVDEARAAEIKSRIRE